MPLNKDYDGDALKWPGAFLAISIHGETGEINGLYCITDEGTFLRDHYTWVTATGLALYQLSGSQLVEMKPGFIDPYDEINILGGVPTHEQVEAWSADGPPGFWAANEASADAAAEEATARRAWQFASRIVASRPWLDVTWVALDSAPGHLVVHDGPTGAALHFEEVEGPTWELRSGPEQDVAWEQLDDVNAGEPTGAVAWVEAWGPPAQSPEVNAKAAIYTLIAHLLSDDSSDGRWAARTAKLLHATDESAEGPDSAFGLTVDFPSLAGTVRWYVDQLMSFSWGEGAIWHEPLWLLTRDDQPRLVLDEAGQVHLRATSEQERDVLKAVLNVLGDEDSDQVDVLAALPRVAGDLARLVSILRSGPSSTPPSGEPDSTPTTEGADLAVAPEPSRTNEAGCTTSSSWLTKRHETPVTWESKVRGLLLGLALGDANLTDVTTAASHKTLRAGAATQMAAWTADGLLRCATRYGVIQDGVDVTTMFVEWAYRRWASLRGLHLPHAGLVDEHGGWLIDVPAMGEMRGRPSSMDQAMQTGRSTDRDTCRPMLRALPIAALAGMDDFTHFDDRQAGILARGVAEITHRNPDVGDAAATAVRLAVLCLRGHCSFQDVFREAMPVRFPPSMGAVFQAAREASDHPASVKSLQRLAPDGTSASVLAGAIYAASSFSVWRTATDALEFAREAPDGDGVAGLVGALLGALHGYEVFPTSDLARLELGWVMDRLAIDIAVEVRDNLLPIGGVKEGAEPWLDPWWKVKYPQG